MSRCSRKSPRTHTREIPPRRPGAGDRWRIAIPKTTRSAEVGMKKALVSKYHVIFLKAGMRLRHMVRAGLVVVPFLALLAQHGFREFPYEETNPAPVPPDANEKTEWAFARLRYPLYGGRG